MVRGSGVGVFLHSCSRFDVVGSPTKLRERGFSSESLSLGSVNHPRRLAVFRFSWVLRPEVEQGFEQLNLCYDLVGFKRKPGQSFVSSFTLLLILFKPLFRTFRE